MTITCLHCGSVEITDPSHIYRVRTVLSALRAGAAPLGAITCPKCNGEVFARDVVDVICTYCPDFNPRAVINDGATHGICVSCKAKIVEQISRMEWERRI